MIKSIDETMRNSPKVIIPNNAKYSPFLYSFSSPEDKLTMETSIVAKITICLKKDAKGSRTIASLNKVVVLKSF